MAFRWPKFVSSFANLENESESDINVRNSLKDQPADAIAPKKLFMTPLPKEALPSLSRPSSKNILTPSHRAQTPSRTPTGTRTPSKTITPLKRDTVTQRYYRNFKARRDSPGVHKPRKWRNHGPDATPRTLRHSPRGGYSSSFSAVKFRGTPTTKKRFEIVKPEFWIKVQEAHLTAWINSILVPEQPSKSTPIGSWEDSAVLANRICAMHQIFMSDKVQTANSRLNDLIASAQLFISRDIRLRTHFEHQDFLVRLLLINYNPNWLYPALCVLFGFNFSSQMDAALNKANTQEGGDSSDKVIMQTLEDILRERLLNPDIVPLQCDPAITPRTSKIRQTRNEDNYNGTVLSQTFALILLLDVAKQEHFKVIETDPPLFRSDSKMASSEDVIRCFAERFLRSEGDIIRHLSLKSFPLSFEAPLAERITSLHVRNIFLDMKDGVRICKLASIITKNSKLMDSIQIFKNASDREVHVSSLRNVNLSLKTISQFLQRDMRVQHQWAAKSLDIVQAESREKTLALMWQISDIWIRAIVLDKQLLANEVSLLNTSFKNKKTDGRASENESSWYSDKFNPTANLSLFMANESEEAKSLLSWAALVCAHYDVKVREFTESFRDGLALCCLVNYYRPDILSIDDAVRVTSVGSVDEDFAAKEASIVEQNFDLFTRAAIELGDIPHIPVSIRAATAPAFTPSKDDAFGRLMYLMTAYIFKRMVTAMRAGIDKENISSLLTRTFVPVHIHGSPVASPLRERNGPFEISEQTEQSVAFTPKFTALSPRKLMNDIHLSQKNLAGSRIGPVSQSTDVISTVSSTNLTQSPPTAPRTVSHDEHVITIQAAFRASQSLQRVLALAARQSGAAKVIQRNWRAYSFRKRTEAGISKKKDLSKSRKSLFGWNAITRDIVENTRRIFAKLESRMRAANHVTVEMLRIEQESAALNVQRALRRSCAKKAFSSFKVTERKRESKSNAIAAAGLAVAGMAAALTAAQAYGKRVGGILELAENAFNAEVRHRFVTQMQMETAKIAALIAIEQQRAQYNQSEREALAADRTELNALQSRLQEWEDSQVVYDDDDSQDSGSEDMEVLSGVESAANADAEAERCCSRSNEHFENYMKECDALLQRAATEEDQRRRYEELLARKQSQIEENQKKLDKESEGALRKASDLDNARRAAQDGVMFSKAVIDVYNNTASALQSAENAFIERITVADACASRSLAQKEQHLSHLTKELQGIDADRTSATQEMRDIEMSLTKEGELLERKMDILTAVNSRSADVFISRLSECAEMEQSVEDSKDSDTEKSKHLAVAEDEFKKLSSHLSAGFAEISELRRQSLAERKSFESAIEELESIEAKYQQSAAAAKAVPEYNDDGGIFSGVENAVSADAASEGLWASSNELFENCKQEYDALFQRASTEEDQRRKYEELLARKQLLLEERQRKLDKESEDTLRRAKVLHNARRAAQEGVLYSKAVTDVYNNTTSTLQSAEQAFIDHIIASDACASRTLAENEQHLSDIAKKLQDLEAGKLSADQEMRDIEISLTKEGELLERKMDMLTTAHSRSADGLISRLGECAEMEQSVADCRQSDVEKSKHLAVDVGEFEKLSSRMSAGFAEISELRRQSLAEKESFESTIEELESVEAKYRENAAAAKADFTAQLNKRLNLAREQNAKKRLLAAAAAERAEIARQEEEEMQGTLVHDDRTTEPLENNLEITRQSAQAAEVWDKENDYLAISDDAKLDRLYSPTENISVAADDAQLLIDMASNFGAEAEAQRAARNSHVAMSSASVGLSPGIKSSATAATGYMSSYSQSPVNQSLPDETTISYSETSIQASNRYTPGDYSVDAVSAYSSTAQNGSECNDCTSQSTATSQVRRREADESSESAIICEQSEAIREKSIAEHKRGLVAASVSVVETNKKICATSVDTMSIFNEMGELLPAGMRDAAGQRNTDEALDSSKLAEWQSEFYSSLQTPDPKILQAHMEQCESREENKEELWSRYGSIFDEEPSLSEDLESIARQFEQTKIMPSMGKDAVTASKMPSTIRRLSLMASSSTMKWSPAEAKRLRKKEEARTVETMRMGLLIVRGCSKRRGESRFVEKAMLLLTKLCSKLHGCKLLMSIPDSFDVLVTCAQFYRDTFSVLNPCVSLLTKLGEEEDHRLIMAKRTASVRILTKLARFLSAREAQIVRTTKKLENANQVLEELVRRGIPVSQDTTSPKKDVVFSSEIRACWKKLVSFNRVFNIETRT